MEDELPRPTADDADCTTTYSFDDHGIDDGAALLTDTYYRLAGEAVAYEPNDRFFEQLADAFRWAYLAEAATTEVPEHVALAIEDARERTTEEFADRPEADLRTEVVPAFYRAVAGFHCAYRA
jgi:hypothetical protein